MVDAAVFPSGGEDEGLKCSALAAIVPTVGDEGWTKGAESAGGETPVSLFASFLTSILDEEVEGVVDVKSVLLAFLETFRPNKPVEGFFSRTGRLWLFSIWGRSLS
jgi:hypothetical protein